MTTTNQDWRTIEIAHDGYREQVDTVQYHFAPTRREFVQVLGAGLMIAVAASAFAQAEPAGPAAGGRGRGGGRGGFGGGGAATVAARLHIAKDGAITIMTGKVECGQGARAELSQVAAEELRVPLSQVTMIMGDTALCPDDGGTYGSMTTPRTVPPVRQAAAAARTILVGLACATWGVPAGEVTVSDGKVSHAPSQRTMTYADLAGAQDLEKTFARPPGNAAITPVADWKIMGTPALRPNGRAVITGRHPYPSDMARPGMLYGKVLRAASYGAARTSLDTTDAKAMKDVVVVQDGDFAGVAAPTLAQAQAALDALTLAARWTSPPHPSSKDLPAYLRQHAQVPPNDFQPEAGARMLKASYFIPYIQHAPMEPRAAMAEWLDGKLTVWTGSQVPTQVRADLMNAFRLTPDSVRVIVNDFGGGFGGKHDGQVAVEAARLARAAGKPVSLRWTREEEFTWAMFRPAGAIDAQATLDNAGRVTSWYFININSGGQAVQPPYSFGRVAARSVGLDVQTPLRHSSYRGLAATANIFARECFIDELADAAGKDPLAFRLAHLQDPRLQAVLQTVAQRFDWPARSARKDPNVGVGLACGTEKGSYLATCAEVALDRASGTIAVRHLAQVFECGKIINPTGLLSQVQGAMVQALGPVLREEMIFEGGRMQNASFADYQVPRFADLPTLDIFLLDRPDVASAGAGETPLMGVAPAVTNAVCRALGKRLRTLPLRIADTA